MSVIMIFSFLREKFQGSQEGGAVRFANGRDDRGIGEISVEEICLPHELDGRMGVRVGNKPKAVQR